MTDSLVNCQLHNRFRITMNRETTMAKSKAPEHHTVAATHHETAAQHYKEATKAHEGGNQKAADHAQMAPGSMTHAKEDVYERIQDLTDRRGAGACIDAVGTEAEPTASADSMLDRVKVATYLGTDRPHILRQASHCCRNFGTVSIVGVYGGSTRSRWAPQSTAG
jgi:threonine dehydrogenase-like Zn-dependent dehydrogenase